MGQRDELFRFGSRNAEDEQVTMLVHQDSFSAPIRRANMEVQKPGQARQAKRHSQREKAWWVCLLASVTFCLWGSNGLKIQQLEYRLTTNLAISQHRLPLLHRLANRTKSSDSLSHMLFSRVEVQFDDAGHSAANGSDLRSVRVNIVCNQHSDVREIELALNQLTTPSEESAECVVFEKQILKERWMLASNSHSIKRLEMDREREKVAIETDRDASEMTASRNVDETESGSPFRLTSFGVRDDVSAPQSGLMNSLLQLNQIRTDNIESMTQTLSRLREKSKGFLSLTGSPRMDPIVKSITPFRFLVLSVLCALVWLLLMGWLQPVRGSIALLRKQIPTKPTAAKHETKRAAYKDDRSKSATELTSLGIDKTLHWLQKEGIPYLGSIQIALWPKPEKESNSNTVILDDVHERTTASSDNLIEDLELTRQVRSLRFLKRLSEGSIVLWLGLFAFRLIFDPLWRELVLVAPLAALSRIILGIQ